MIQKLKWCPARVLSNRRVATKCNICLICANFEAVEHLFSVAATVEIERIERREVCLDFHGHSELGLACLFRLL